MDMHADMRAQRFRPRTIGAAEIGAAENENAAGTGHAPAPVQVLAGMVPEKGPERGLYIGNALCVRYSIRTTSCTT